MNNAADEQNKGGRIIGYDLARSLAMLGMIVVHFTLVASGTGAGDQHEPSLLSGLIAALDGRPAALFMVLAGIGLALMSRRARLAPTPAVVAGTRRVFIRRGVFLLLIGFVNLLIWPGDILRVYGVSFFIAAALMAVPGRRLLAIAGLFVLVFSAMVLFADFDRHWDWETLTYHGLWTWEGVFRNLLFDGFRSVLPWAGFVLFGMWLGRLDLTDPKINRRLFVAAVAVAVGAELLSRTLLSYWFTEANTGVDRETLVALFGTQSVPALPLFLLAAGGTAVAVIALCVRLGQICPRPVLQPLVAMGQMALTWYFAHIVIGLGALEEAGMVGTETLPVAAAYGLGFFIVAVLLSWIYKRRFRSGPLEWLMRKAGGS